MMGSSAAKTTAALRLRSGPLVDGAAVLAS